MSKRPRVIAEPIMATTVVTVGKCPAMRRWGGTVAVLEQITEASQDLIQEIAARAGDSEACNKARGRRGLEHLART